MYHETNLFLSLARSLTVLYVQFIIGETLQSKTSARCAYLARIYVGMAMAKSSEYCVVGAALLLLILGCLDRFFLLLFICSLSYIWHSFFFVT